MNRLRTFEPEFKSAQESHQTERYDFPSANVKAAQSLLRLREEQMHNDYIRFRGRLSLMKDSFELLQSSEYKNLEKLEKLLGEIEELKKEYKFVIEWQERCFRFDVHLDFWRTLQPKVVSQLGLAQELEDLARKIMSADCDWLPSYN